jgi:hypothetical protein
MELMFQNDALGEALPLVLDVFVAAIGLAINFTNNNFHHSKYR